MPRHRPPYKYKYYSHIITDNTLAIYFPIRSPEGSEGVVDSPSYNSIDF